MCSVDVIRSIVNLHSENACALFVFELVMLFLFPWGITEDIQGFDILEPFTLAISRLLFVQKILVLCCSENINPLVDFLFCKLNLSLWVSGHPAAAQIKGLTESPLTLHTFINTVCIFLFFYTFVKGQI